MMFERGEIVKTNKTVVAYGRLLFPSSCTTTGTVFMRGCKLQVIDCFFNANNLKMLNVKDTAYGKQYHINANNVSKLPPKPTLLSYLQEHALGRKNAIHATPLANVLGITLRDLRHRIRKINDTVGVAKVVGDYQVGYYVVSNSDEARTMYFKQHAKAMRELNKLKVLRQTFEEHGQLSFNGEGLELKKAWEESE